MRRLTLRLMRWVSWARGLCAALLVFGAVCAFPQQCQAAIYNSWEGFSSSQNPNGVWTYGRTDHPGSTTIVVYQDLGPIYDEHLGGWLTFWYDENHTNPWARYMPCVYQVDAIAGQVHSLRFHPGWLPDADYSVVRWTAPGAGTSDIWVTFTGADLGTKDVFVYYNGNLFDSADLALFESHSYSSPAIAVEAGDMIEFIVGNGGDDGWADSVTLDATVRWAPVPEPGTLIVWSLLGASAISGGWWRRRKRAG